MIDMTLERWEVSDVQIRRAGPPRAGPAAVVSAQLSLKNAANKMAVTLPPAEFQWVRRLDNAWYFTRPPRPVDR